MKRAYREVSRLRAPASSVDLRVAAYAVALQRIEAVYKEREIPDLRDDVPHMPYVRTRLGRLFYEERGAPSGRAIRRSSCSRPALRRRHVARAGRAALASLGRVVVFDGPGHGKSEPAPRFMLEEHADALLDAFGELGIERAVVVGLSWGGMVGMRLALQHPARVAALAVLDSSAEPQTLAERVRYRAFIALHRRVGFPMSLFDKEVAPLMFAPRTLIEQPELVGRELPPRDGVRARRPRAGRARGRRPPQGILDQLGKVRVPTLVMCGREDRSTTPDKSEKSRAPSRARSSCSWTGLGHMSALEAPERVNAELVPFVRGEVVGPAETWERRGAVTPDPWSVRFAEGGVLCSTEGGHVLA